MTEQKAVFEAPTEAPAESGEASKRRIVTMEAWGKKLPIGIPTAEGLLNKSFSTRPWKTKDERKLGKLKKPDMSLGSYVGAIVATMCDSIGDTNLSAIEKQEERQVHIQRMYMGDVFYIYCWLRHEAMGDQLKVSFTCPTCQKKLPYVGNLLTSEVAVVDSIEALRWAHELHDPIRLRGKDVTKFQMSTSRWSTIDGHRGSRDDANAKVTAVRGSIVALNDDNDAVALGEAELDDLTKRDLEALAEQIDERFMGPNMALEGKCTPEMCPMGGGYDFRVPIDWSYNSFFSGSSK